MKSDIEINSKLLNFELNARMSLSRFFIFGWFGWAIMLVAGFIISPFVWLAYFLSTFSFSDASHFTSRRLKILTKQGAGFILKEEDR